MSLSNVSQTTREKFYSDSIEEDGVEDFIPPSKNNPQIRASSASHNYEFQIKEKFNRGI